MLPRETLATLEHLESEMAGAGRSRELAALQEARRQLAGSRKGLLTTGEAARELGVSIPTVKFWIKRGALTGWLIGNRWLVTQNSVEHNRRLREILKKMDEEGNPTDDEIRELYARRQPGQPRSAVA